MRIVSWNIQDGGGAHFEQQMALIRAQNPDIVFLQEAKGWLARGNTLLYLAEHLLGMRPYVAKARRHDCNLVIFVRPGFATVVRHRNIEEWPFWHAQARLILDNGLVLADSHFAPFSPSIRVEEALACTDLAAGPAILAGDFNFDGPDRSLRATIHRAGRLLGRCFAPSRTRRQPGYKRVRHSVPGTRKPDTRAARILAACGFVDVAEQLAHVRKDRSLLAPTAGFKWPSIARRVDRIYVSGGAVIIDYWIIDGHQLSDHHPIGAEVHFPDLTPSV